MGRHAADRPAPESGGTGGRQPLHADLFTLAPVSYAARMGEARAAAAFERLVQPHREALEDYVLKLTQGDEAMTEPVLKETYYRASQDPARYPHRPSAVRPWLVLTARTVLRDGERLAPAGHDDRPEPWPSGERSTGPAPPPAATVVRAMDDLAATHRDIFVELFYRGISLEEAAQVRGVPVETIKSRLYFAMRALRVVLDQQVAERHDGR
jgi:RNA polymerase sigma-70 factor (ECF subfamily)